MHSDRVAVIRQLLTIDHLPTNWPFVSRSNLGYVASLPGVFRNDSGTVWTDVIDVCLLLPVGTHTLFAF